MNTPENVQILRELNMSLAELNRTRQLVVRPGTAKQGLHAEIDSATSKVVEAIKKAVTTEYVVKSDS